MIVAPSPPDTRLIIESHHDFEDGVILAVHEDGSISISVAEEQAVDSYNEMVTCTCTMSREQAAVLRNWLYARLATPAKRGLYT